MPTRIVWWASLVIKDLGDQDIRPKLPSDQCFLRHVEDEASRDASLLDLLE